MDTNDQSMPDFNHITLAFTRRNLDDGTHLVDFYKIIALPDETHYVFEYKKEAIQTAFGDRELVR